MVYATYRTTTSRAASMGVIAASAAVPEIVSIHVACTVLTVRTLPSVTLPPNVRAEAVQDDAAPQKIHPTNG